MFVLIHRHYGFYQLRSELKLNGAKDILSASFSCFLPCKMVSLLKLLSAGTAQLLARVGDINLADTLCWCDHDLSHASKLLCSKDTPVFLRCYSPELRPAVLSPMDRSDQCKRGAPCHIPQSQPEPMWGKMKSWCFPSIKEPLGCWALSSPCYHCTGAWGCALSTDLLACQPRSWEPLTDSCA